ncbi:CHASE2 domain-containing protein [Pararoseomonas indoligenes]|uniref:CHASE2 domain-containing protein n=1 Tax=Roseomonas indoligenes TaxID=2820811 RepID=A0A940S9Q6_9PROT|nr:CHASE2 domain-containing protein [Pararoseomonas indoligenes]MBP0495538.1 CHASE2 domain-containing protein [Pararoseomonas indoligenes]
MPRAEAGALRGPGRLLRRRAVRALLSAQAVAVLVLLARGAGLLQPVELAWYDAAMRQRAGSAESAEIGLVLADENDITRFGWPLPDGVLARLLSRLSEAGAAAVAVDLYRDRPVGEGSEALAAVLAAEPRILWAFRLGEEGRPGISPPPALRGTARAAFADVVADPGEVVRRALLAATEPESGRVVPSLGAALAARIAGARLRPAGEDLTFGEGRLRLLEEPFGPYAQLDAAGYQTLLDYRGTFRRLSIAEVIDGGAAALAGRGVVVGMDSLSVRDSFTTPLGTGLVRTAPMPGAAVHAHLAAGMLRVARGEAGPPAPPPRPAEYALVWAAAMLGAAIPLAAPPLGWATVAGGLAALSLAALLGGALLAFGLGLLLPAIPAALGLALSTGLSAWLLLGLGHRQRLQLHRSFEHYMDPRLVGAVLAAEIPPRLGGEHREITAIFTDIAGFTTLAEALPPERLAELLNAYFEGMAAAVMRHGGLVNDFIGDGMVALFGAPLVQPDHAERAVAAALAADSFAQGFAASLAAEGIPFGHTRIGVHSGLALVGNLGTRSRLKYGALGDTLNIAARLESLSRFTGTRLLVSAETAGRTPGRLHRLVGEVLLAGRTGRIGVLVPHAGSAEAAALHESAMGAIRAGDAGLAARRLETLAAMMPDDPVIAFHRARLAAGLCSLEVRPDGK